VTTRDPRVEQLEGGLARIATEQTKARQDIRDLRFELMTAIRAGFVTLLLVNLIMWVIVLGMLFGLVFTGG
jgi:hypothetical protein